MGSLGFPELMVILVIVFLIFGASRLPQLGAGVGSAIKNFKDGLRSSDEPKASSQSGACANCGTANPSDSKFCRKCGKPL